MRRFDQFIRHPGHFGKSSAHVDAGRSTRNESEAPEDQIPGAGELVPKKQKGTDMTNNETALRSGSAAIIFFTALSSVSAIATALLPFLVHA
jgi:hypothetical protein